MKRWAKSLHQRNESARFRTCLIGPLLILALASASGRAKNDPVRLNQVDSDFYIHTLGDRCLDFGAEASWAIGQPVFIYSCNGTVAQRVRVKEIADGAHDVELRVRDTFCIGVRASDRRPGLGSPLELQSCDGSPAQRFALDGDAILMGTQRSGRVSREFVVEPARGSTVSRTPLVVGTREVGDAEYFRFLAVDRSDARPHSGFVLVSSEEDLDRELTSAGTWGKVIEIDDRKPIRLSGVATKSIPAGVTLRGYRKYTLQGPELFRCSNSVEPAFTISEEDVRLTGFRLRGPVGDRIRCPFDLPTTVWGPDAIQINAHTIALPVELPPKGGTTHVVHINVTTVPRVLIDHLDIGYWNGSGIDVEGPDPGPDPDPNDGPPGTDDDYLTDCPNPPLRYPREARLRAIGNFLHHLNPYGVVTGKGAFALVDGNVFFSAVNHAIASSGAKTTGYLAYHNLMLSPSSSPEIGHEIDVHGSLDRGHWLGGIAGNYYDVGWNTVLGSSPTRVNFKLRGTPCHRVDLHHNVFRSFEAFAVRSHTLDAANKLKRWANVFGETATMNDLGVGDFDGDGIDDVFVGTGAAWYFSSGGRSEWRFLNRMPEKASALRFGDFDGDRRTDVLALHEGRIEISWAGASSWQAVNVTPWKLSDLAVGDFDGDRHSDLFLATDAAWFVAPGARNWAPYSSQAHRTPNLRFGDLTKDGKTDVVAVVDGKWRMLTRHSGAEQWVDLHPSLSGSLAGVVVGDFTGDGKADLARSANLSWWLSDAGTAKWSRLRSAIVPGYGTITNLNLVRYPIGRFNHGDPTADIVFWSGTTGLHFDHAPGGRDPIERLSRQAMR